MMIDLSKGKLFGIDLVLSDYHNDIRVAIFPWIPWILLISFMMPTEYFPSPLLPHGRITEYTSIFLYTKAIPKNRF